MVGGLPPPIDATWQISPTQRLIQIPQNPEMPDIALQPRTADRFSKGGFSALALALATDTINLDLELRGKPHGKTNMLNIERIMPIQLVCMARKNALRKL